MADEKVEPEIKEKKKDIVYHPKKVEHPKKKGEDTIQILICVGPLKLERPGKQGPFYTDMDTGPCGWAVPALGAWGNEAETYEAALAAAQKHIDDSPPPETEDGMK